MHIATVKTLPMHVDGVPVLTPEGEPMKKEVQLHWMSDKNAPLWTLLKPVAYAAALGVLLSFTSSHFDAGEVKTIVGTFVTGVIFEGFGIRKVFS
jgi:hypothetical protein